MASFGKKKTLTEYLYSKVVIGALLFVVVMLFIAVYERYSVERQMLRRRIEADKDKAELIERKGELEERVKYLGGERGIEEEIRTHFDVAKEGEKVIILVGEDPKEEAQEVSETKNAPWYKFWQ